MLEVDRGHKYHPPIPSSPIATFRFCFLVHLLPQALFTAFWRVFLGPLDLTAPPKGIYKLSDLPKPEDHTAIYTSQKTHEREKPTAALTVSQNPLYQGRSRAPARALSS